MAINAHFGADFDQFYDAVEGATLRLKTMQEGGGRVESQLNRVANSLSGRKLVQDALIAAEAVERLGGVTKLTTQELARLGPQADQAAQKMRAMGQAVPANLQRLAAAGADAQTKLGKVSQAIGVTEQAVSALGIALPAGASGLLNFGQAAINAATGIGRFGVVLAPLLTAIAAAKVGGKIGEWTGLTDAIGRGTAAIEGFGDVIQEEALAGLDTLGRASKIAGTAITDLGLAEQINRIHAEELIAANIKLSDSNKRLAADAEKRLSIEEANRTKLLKLEHDLALAQAKRRGDEAKAWADILAKRNADQQKSAAEWQSITDQMIQAKIDSGRAWQEVDLENIRSQAAVAEKVKATTLELEAQRWAAVQALNASLVVQKEFDLSTPEGRAAFLTANPQGEIAAPASYFEEHTLADAIAAGVVKLTGGSGMAAGATGAAASTWHGMAATVVAPVNVTVSGVFDPTAKVALTRAVGEGLYTALKTARKPGLYKGRG